MRYELKNPPQLKLFVRTIMPSYRKTQVSLSEFRPIQLNSYWDGGSKSEYRLVHLDTFRTLALPTSTHPYFDVARYGVQGENEAVSVDARGNVTLKTIPVNMCLVETGYFCGKPMTASFYLHPDNMQKLLPEASLTPQIQA